MKVYTMAAILVMPVWLASPVSANYELVKALGDLAKVVKDLQLGRGLTKAEIALKFLEEADYQTKIINVLMGTQPLLVDGLENAMRYASTTKSLGLSSTEVSSLVKRNFLPRDVVIYTEGTSEFHPVRGEYYESAVQSFEEAIRRVLESDSEAAIKTAKRLFGSSYEEILNAVEHLLTQPIPPWGTSGQWGAKPRLTREEKTVLPLSAFEAHRAVTVQKLLEALGSGIASAEKPPIVKVTKAKLMPGALWEELLTIWDSAVDCPAPRIS